MTSMRRLAIGGAALLLSASVGCSTTSHHRREHCATCESSPVYQHYDVMPPGVNPVDSPTSPTPILPPQPESPPAPLPPVPTPPTGSAERPSRMQSLRDHTRELFRSASNNVRDLFARNDDARTR